MSGEIHYGICDKCGKEANLIRHYDEFAFPCECHSPHINIMLLINLLLILGIMVLIHFTSLCISYQEITSANGKLKDFFTILSFLSFCIIAEEFLVDKR